MHIGISYSRKERNCAICRKIDVGQINQILKDKYFIVFSDLLNLELKSYIHIYPYVHMCVFDDTRKEIMIGEK